MDGFADADVDVSAILDGLNDAQRKAVTLPADAIRVIAGAGSGKTRVLVQRMQWLMAVEGISPHGLLALTFTNKAAREMRQRLENATGQAMTPLSMGTFHGICHRILRRFAERMDWPQGFVIIDREDQLRMIKRMLRERNWDEELISPRQIQAQIDAYKQEGLRAADVPVTAHPVDVAVRELYRDYEIACRRQGAMDFAELLLLTVELLAQHAQVKAHFHQRFQSILVDEFQDTNTLQFTLIRELLGEKAKLFVVGDDDQSIYGWRGAKVENILELERAYPELQTIRLEQNYRSTQTILHAANAVIAKNQRRLGKRLWSAGAHGEAVRVYAALNEYDETRYVIETITQWVETGGGYDECAILYRSNAQSRVFEEGLRQKRIPYRVYGGLRFFERAEVKDALAYLRLTRQRDDDGALERVLNQPPRGIGARTQTNLRELARREGVSLWQIIADPALVKAHFNARAGNALSAFAALLSRLHREIGETNSLKKALEIAVYRSGLYAHLEGQAKEEAETRRENLDELINAGSYVDMVADQQSDKVIDFLADAALDAGDGQAQEGESSVQLMTLHSAKGLEFANVFIVAMEEDIFPSQRSLEDPARLEEERRLAYVGMTRAEKRLTLSFAERRRFQGRDTYPQPSRFVREVPRELIEAVRPLLFTEATAVRGDTAPTQPGSAQELWRTGEMVRHGKFGEGCIVSLEGSDAHRRALVNFAEAGEKWLVLAYAKLEKIS